MSQPIAKYYAQKDANNWPIPGTMMGTTSNIIPSTAVEIPTTTGTKSNPNGLRYFVRTDNGGRILPNSLMITLQRPSDVRLLEFRLP